jgi:predicted nucleotide-binding protein
VKIIRRSEDSPYHKIFLVHGHVAELKQTVAEFLRSFALEVIILHEKANQGQTIIEKFEKHSEVGFAVVLLTPDDFGGSAAHPEKTRRRVCCLYLEGVELPSDYDGVLYVPYSENGGWQSNLIKELAAAGIAVDPSGRAVPIALTKRKLLA